MKALPVVLLAALAVAPDASAQILGVLETHRTNSPANCAGARPSDRAALRMRPLAVVNEYGTESVYVTCSFGSPDGLLGIEMFGARFTNLSPEPKTVTCTGVVGEEGTPRYYVKSLNLGPLASASLNFTGNDNNDLLFGDRLSVSCLVPTQVGINDNWVSVLLPLL